MAFMHLTLPSSLQGCKDGEYTLSTQDGDDDNVKQLIIRSDGGPDDYNHTNPFWKNFNGNDEFRDKIQSVESLIFLSLSLDNWEPILTTLQQQFGINIEDLELSCCHLTERGARVLGNLLKTGNNMTANENEARVSSNICIKKLNLESLEGSTAWIDGFLRNKTITFLDLAIIPVLSNAIRYIQNSPQLKEVALFIPNIEEGGGTEEERFNTDIESLDPNASMNLETFKITFARGKQFPLNACKGIGCILRQAKKLQTVKLTDLKGDLPYDFLMDAIHCKKLDLHESDIDLRTLSFLIRGDAGVGGKLNRLSLHCPNDESKVGHVLQLADFSLLKEFYITASRLTDALCHHLAANKGPRVLFITIEGGYLNNVETRQLASSLVGNDKVVLFVIATSGFGDDLEPQLELLNAMATMPQLQGWMLWVGDRQRLKTEYIEKWKECIVSQLQSNRNIVCIYPPFADLGDDIEDLLLINKYWRSFCRNHYDGCFSNGIWSLGLSQIEKAGMMYNVIREVPDLFQEVADAASEREKYRFPSFVVPHCHNCPECNKQRQLPDQ